MLKDTGHPRGSGREHFCERVTLSIEKLGDKCGFCHLRLLSVFPSCCVHISYVGFAWKTQAADHHFTRDELSLLLVSIRVACSAAAIVNMFGLDCWLKNV